MNFKQLERGRHESLFPALRRGKLDAARRSRVISVRRRAFRSLRCNSTCELFFPLCAWGSFSEAGIEWCGWLIIIVEIGDVLGLRREFVECGAEQIEQWGAGKYCDNGESISNFIRVMRLLLEDPLRYWLFWALGDVWLYWRDTEYLGKDDEQVVNNVSPISWTFRLFSLCATKSNFRFKPPYYYLWGIMGHGVKLYTWWSFSV